MKVHTVQVEVLTSSFDWHNFEIDPFQKYIEILGS